MTMPHLSNCEHQGDGWCLVCVKELFAKNEILEAGIKEDENDYQDIMNVLDCVREERNKARERLYTQSLERSVN